MSKDPAALVWTTREVQFQCGQHTSQEEFDGLMNALPETYWQTWRERLLRTTLAISATGLTVYVSGWPWWVPQWVARRSVARVAARAIVGGDAQFIVARTVLVNRRPGEMIEDTDLDEEPITLPSGKRLDEEAAERFASEVLRARAKRRSDEGAEE